MTFVGQAYAQAKRDISAALNTLNRHLLANTYIVGNQLTVADITLATALVDMFRLVFAPGYLKGFGNVVRWFNLVINQPAVKAVVGPVEFAKRETHAPKPKKVAAPKKKQQQQPKKKAAKPQQAKKQKPKDPLMLLPKSKMNLDTVKKLYWAQKPFNPAFFETFDQWFDSEGWAFWEMRYNYNSDNTVYWKAQNALGGFTQRCDGARKWAMGAIFLHGKDEETAPFKISGCYLTRGADKVPQCFMDNPDAEYYTYTKMDVSTPEGKAKLKAFWADQTFEGDNVLDRRHFK